MNTPLCLHDPRSITLCVGSVADIETLQEIDNDACALFVGAGLDLEIPEPYSRAERNRWLESLAAGQTLIATDSSGFALGFAVRGMLDGEPHLDQLSVRQSCMRQGIGRRLLDAASGAAQMPGCHNLWLTTYGHLPWNRPYYERAGFVVVPEAECGRDILQTLRFERQFLPMPDQRVAMRRPLRSD